MRLLPAALTTLSALVFTGHARAAFPVTLPHTSGQATLTRAPVRVVALGPHTLDMLLSLGVQPVGYGEAAQLAQKSYGSPIRQIRNLGSRVTSAPVNVGNRFSPNLEVLLSVRPDLIVGENYASPAYGELNRIAPTLLFHGIHSGDWQKSILTLGRAVGREPQARAVIARHDTLITAAKKTVPTALRGRRAAVIWNSGGSQKDVFTVLGERDWTGGFFRSLGFRLALPGVQDAAMTEGHRTLSSEGLNALDADVIFLVATGTNTPTRARRDWQANALAQRLPASRAGQVYALDGHLFGRLRGPVGEELMARELERQWRAR